MKLNALFNIWDRFLFSPASPYPVAAFRMLFGTIVLLNAILIGPDLYTWYGSHGIVSTQTIDLSNPAVLLNVLNFAQNNDTWLTTVYCIYVLSAICMIVGFQSRLACILVYVAITSFYHRDPYLLNSGDTLLRNLSFWMIFAPTGAAWSADNWIRDRKATGGSKAPWCELVSNWGLRCLQLQICCVYYHAFMTKSAGWIWMTGAAVYVSNRIEPLAKFPLALTPEIYEVSQWISWATLAIEAALFTLIWIKEIRYYVLAVAIAMHMTIEYSMNIPLFEPLMITTYILFVYPEHLSRARDCIVCWLTREAPREGAAQKKGSA